MFEIFRICVENERQASVQRWNSVGSSVGKKLPGESIAKRHSSVGTALEVALAKWASVGPETVGTVLEQRWNSVGTALEQRWNSVGTPLGQKWSVQRWNSVVAALEKIEAKI